MNIQKLAASTIAAVVFTVGAAGAAVLDFNEVSGGFQSSTTITLSNATITSFGTDSFVYNGGSFGTPANGGFCGIAGGGCEAGAQVDFTLGPIADLTFSSMFHDVGDNATVKIFAGLVELASSTFSADTFVDFTGFSGITHLLIDDNSTGGAGYAYVDFEFDQVAAIPVPASLPLMLAAFGGFAALRRRKSKA